MMKILNRTLALIAFGTFLLPKWAVSQTTSQTTPGAVLLCSTLHSIGVRAKYSGDANANNSAAIQFRQTGQTNWLAAYPPIIDRRPASDQYTNEARGSIVGLAPDTSYEVVITWSDPDGVVGPSSITNTIQTLSYLPPTGGSVVTVTNDAGLSNALRTVTAGQTIHLNPGVYSPFLVLRGGTLSAFVTVEGELNGSSIVAGTNANQNVYLGANCVVISHLTFGPSDHSGLVFANGLSGLYVQDCTMQNISVTCPVTPTGNYSDCGVNIASGCSNVFILRNAIYSPALDNPACTLSPNYQSPGTGISWRSGTATLVVESNNVIGGFRDGISQDDSGALTENVDVVGNFVANYKDDGVESKGLNVNVRIWSNWVTNDVGNTFFACNDNVVTNPPGPCYLFRNCAKGLASNTNGAASYKLGVYCAPIFIFHNTVDSSATSATMDGVSAGSPVTYKNNIMKTRGSCILFAPSRSVFDYDLYYITTGAWLVYNWNGVPNLFYAGLLDFRSGAGQELHGVQADPFLGPGLLIPVTSPAVDAGLLLPNFNSSDSAWPFRGTAPDIGAWEASAAPPPPTGLTVVGSP